MRLRCLSSLPKNNWNKVKSKILKYSISIQTICIGFIFFSRCIDSQAKNFSVFKHTFLLCYTDSKSKCKVSEGQLETKTLNWNFVQIEYPFCSSISKVSLLKFLTYFHSIINLCLLNISEPKVNDRDIDKFLNYRGI